LVIVSTTTGAMAITTLDVRGGIAAGSAVGARGGLVQVTNKAAGQGLTVGNLALSGVNNAHAGSVALRSQGALTVNGDVNATGGALNPGADADGRDAGSITLAGSGADQQRHRQHHGQRQRRQRHRSLRRRRRQHHRRFGRNAAGRQHHRHGWQRHG
jgi:hypothetical protein